MNDETPEPGPKPNRLVEMLMKHDQPIFTLDTERLGRLNFHRLSVGGQSALADDEAATTTPRDFVDHLIGAVGRRDPSEAQGEAQPLGDGDVGKLSEAERSAIVKGLIDGLELQYEIVHEPKDAPDGERSVAARYEVTTPQEDGEDDEAYLLRAWTVYRDRERANHKKMMEAIAGPKVSDLAKLGLLPGLAANMSASKRLAEQLAYLKPGGMIGKALEQQAKTVKRATDLGLGKPFGESFAVPRAPELPQLNYTPPPNPVHETNTLLADMGEQIAAMHAVALTSAEMQRSLNDVALKAVADFATGAEQSKKSGDRALLVSVIAAVIAALSIIVTLWLSRGQGQHAKRQATIEAARHREEVGLRERELAATQALADQLRQSRAKPPSQAAGKVVKSGAPPLDQAKRAPAVPKASQASPPTGAAGGVKP